METQMAGMETRLIKWLIGAMAASIVSVIGTALSIAKLCLSAQNMRAWLRSPSSSSRSFLIGAGRAASDRAAASSQV